MAASAADIEKFLSGPLVRWLSHCVKKPDCLQVYETLFDGTAINEVLLQIDPEPSVPVPTIGNLQDHNHITTARIKIFHCIVKNIKIIYEEELGQIIINLPDCVMLGRMPTSQGALQQLELLILLLLGCAVQCPNKELFINKIKELELDLQHDIVECIKQVTDGQNLVITTDVTASQTSSPEKLLLHVRKLINERDVLLQQLISDLGQIEEHKLKGNSDSGTNVGDPISLLAPSGIATATATSGGSGGGGNDGSIESHHWAVEMADWKAKLRKQRQELEEKTEILAEYKEDLEHANNQISKLKTENSELITEARKAKIYQDELDAMRERAERADRLELEIQRFRERLIDAEFYKVRVDELREDNRVLLETREILEQQLVKMRQRTDQILELESELLTSKKTINETMLERDSARDRVHELYEENLQLQQLIKVSLQEKKMENLLAAAAAAAEASANAEDLDGTNNSGDNSLSEQLINNAQARALKLELENKRLLNTIDSLKEANFHENSTKILELEKDKKKLLLKCEQLQENCERFSQQNVELENLFKNAIQENKKLQSTLDSQKIVSDRQSQDLQNEKLKIIEMEKNIDGLTKEKQRIQSLCDIVKKRADDADNCLNQVSEQLQNLQIEVEKGRHTEKLNNELKETINQLEKENGLLQKEVVKFKETIEMKDVILDKNIEEKLQQEKEIQKFHQETLCLHSQVEKLQEFEQKATELVSQASIHVETINTLQKDLINEKVSNEKLKSNLDRLGLNLDVLDNDMNVVVEKMLENSDISKHIYSIFIEKQDDFVKQIQKDSSSLNNNNNLVQQQRDDVDALQNENATLKVDLSTLKSQMHSLQAQQTVLQLANSQLVAEKEELSKLRQIQTDKQGALLEDQKIFRKLHEQLNNEYEILKIDQESLKRTIRDLRSEIRSLKEKNNNLEMKISTSEIEKDTLKNDARNLTNLRIEHSKLKDDFRNLFTASERLKVEYRNIQDEIKNLKMESRNFRLRETEIQGELTTRSDTLTSLHLDNAKLHQKCDLLFEMNHSLDADRRALMDHVSQLLTQYHSLLTHSLEDKQQYHLEEKLFSDKLNNLCRQKEKLEEKIMEHYKKLDSVSSTKKKGFGSTFVKRVRKAGSDFINKVPSRNHRRSWHEDSSSQFTLADPQQQQQHSSEHDSDNNNEHTVTDEFGSFKRNTIATGSGHSSGYKLRDEIPLRRSQRESRCSSIAGDEIYGGSTNTSRGEPPGSALSLGSVGSRRTVYLSEDDTGPIVHASTPSLSNPNIPTANPPLLVYNRISTVIGGSGNNGSNGGDNTLRSYSIPQHYSSTPPLVPPPSSSSSLPDPLSAVVNTPNNNEKKEKNSKETAIWYEYGCV